MTSVGSAMSERICKIWGSRKRVPGIQTSKRRRVWTVSGSRFLNWHLGHVWPLGGLPSDAKHDSGELIDPRPQYFWKASRYNLPFLSRYFCKSMPSSWQKVVYTHHQFVSRYASHLYRDTFAEVLGSRVVGTPPNDLHTKKPNHRFCNSCNFHTPPWKCPSFLKTAMTPKLSGISRIRARLRGQT